MLPKKVQSSAYKAKEPSNKNSHALTLSAGKMNDSKDESVITSVQLTELEEQDMEIKHFNVELINE